MIRSWFVVLVASLALAACSPAPLDFDVSGSLEQPVLTFKRSGGIFRSRALCVQAVHVARDGARTFAGMVPDSEAVWRVAARAGECAPMRRLVYGATVPRMATIALPRQLAPGVRYQIWGEAAGGLRGSAVILFEQGRWNRVSERAA